MTWGSSRFSSAEPSAPEQPFRGLVLFLGATEKAALALRTGVPPLSEEGRALPCPAAWRSAPPAPHQASAGQR